MDIAISEEAIPLVRDSVNREIILLESRINLIKKEIEQFEEKYKMTSSEFQKKFDDGELGDSMDLFEWWGLIRGLRTLDDRLAMAKAVVAYW